MVQIPVLERQVRSGEVITADDIALSTFSGKNLRKNTITDNKELIGKSPRRMISQGRPVRQDEIGNPAVLLKGAHVTMLFKTRNLEITTLGEALENGAKGDVIRVKNLASKQIIDAVVEAPGRVRVASPETSAAEAM
jgi:flagella basal body P-ring formation protein FlgA